MKHRAVGGYSSGSKKVGDLKPPPRNENPTEAVMRCWVCEVGVSRPEYFTDAGGTTRIIHNWCVAGAETKSRREKAEGEL